MVEILTTDPIIKLESIVTKFGEKIVHNNVSFEIPRAKVVAIIGGSGAGKSVLLREMLGLLKPTSGTVHIMGKSVYDIESKELLELRRHFGVLFQNGALFSGLTVKENIAVPLIEQLTLPSDVVNSVVDAKLLLSGLPLDAGFKMPSELSGGMRKRAALARALALEPEILFLDEPGSGLDPINARALDDLIRILCDNLKLTICMITHDLTSIRRVCDQIVVLGDGKVLANGTYETVSKIDHPWIKEYFSSDQILT